MKLTEDRWDTSFRLICLYWLHGDLGSMVTLVSMGCVCTIRAWGVLIRIVCLVCREAIKGGLMALRNVIPGGDTFMNLGLEMVREMFHVCSCI